jgi:hypothetical protein
MAQVFTTNQLTTINEAYRFNLAVAQDRLKHGGRYVVPGQEFLDSVQDVLPNLQYKGLVTPSLDFNFAHFSEEYFGVPSTAGSRAVYLNPSIPTSYTGDDRFARFNVDRLSGSDGLKNFVSQFADPKNYLVQSPPAQKTSIWDSVFQPFGGTTSLVEFLNPITAVKAVTKINNSSESSNFITGVIKPQPVNYLDELFQGTTNVIGSVGLAFGVEGVSQGVSGYVSATTPLNTGVQGPVNPGFWSTLTSGNLQGAMDILTAPFSSMLHSPSSDTTVTSTAKATAFGQVVNEFVQLTGNIGKSIIQFVAGDFTGALRTITGPSSSTPTTPVNLFGNFQQGGGGGGAGLGVGAGNSGQSTLNPLMFPALAVSVLFVIWMVMRKK